MAIPYILITIAVRKEKREREESQEEEGPECIVIALGTSKPMPSCFLVDAVTRDSRFQ